jgi:hypothetical protein
MPSRIKELPSPATEFVAPPANKRSPKGSITKNTKKLRTKKAIKNKVATRTGLLARQANPFFNFY